MTAVVGFSTGQSVYAEALVMTAIEENIVLTVPSAVLARSTALIPRGHELGLDVLLGLPCTVVDPLDTVPARGSLSKAVSRVAISSLRTSSIARSDGVGRS